MIRFHFFPFPTRLVATGTGRFHAGLHISSGFYDREFPYSSKYSSVCYCHKKDAGLLALGSCASGILLSLCPAVRRGLGMNKEVEAMMWAGIIGENWEPLQMPSTLLAGCVPT